MRNCNIELFRFFLMIAICFWHIIVHGCGIVNLREGVLFESGLLVFPIAIFIPAVNCFMLISGYYGMKFSIKKILRLSFVGFCILWVAFLLSKILMYEGSVSLKYILLHFIPISTKAWWFLTDYACIMILSPLIEIGLSKISRSKFTCLLAFLFFMNSFGLYINHGSTGNNFLSLLIIYLIGCWLRLYKKDCRKSVLFFFWFCITMLIAFLLYSLFCHSQPKLMWQFMYYNNPLVVFQSIFLFLFVQAFKENYHTLGAFLGANCFGIYLLTEKLGRPLYLDWASSLSSNTIMFAVYFLAIVIISLFLNYALTELFNLISDKMRLQKLDDFIERR